MTILVPGSSAPNGSSKQQDFRIARQRLGNGQPLQHAARQAAGNCVGHMVKPDARPACGHGLFPFLGLFRGTG